jgi:STE20-like kinase
MFLEFCDGGALDSIIVDLEKGLTEAQIAYVTRHICVGLAHLHRCSIIHRDIKAGNVLLTADGNVKLADFGVSAKNRCGRSYLGYLWIWNDLDQAREEILSFLVN